jgi:hypothetical protein
MKYRERLLRAFAVVGAVMTLAALPMALVSAGRVVEHPLALPLGATADGSAKASLPTFSGPVPVVVTEVRYRDGAWRPATRLDSIRERSGLPVGTPVAYRYKRADGSTGEAEGAVGERPATALGVLNRLAWILVAGGLAVGALVLAVGATGLRSLVAAAAIAGTAYVVGLGFLESTLVELGSASMKEALILLSRTFPFDLTYFLLFWMLELFPGALPKASWHGWAGRALLVLGLACSAVTLTGEIPGFLEFRFAQPAQARWLAAQSLLRFGVTLICGLSIVALIAGQWQLYKRAGLRPAERGRTQLAGWALLAGAAPSVVVVSVQAIGRLLTNRLVLPNVVMSLAFAPLVIVPAVVVFLSLSPEAAPAKLLVRRAAVFLLARRTVRAACFAPLVLLAFHLWRHRDEPLSAVLVAHPFTIGAATVGAVLGLAWRESFQRRVEGWLESSPPDADRIVSAVGDRARGATSLDDLAVALSAEVKRGFGVTEAAFFVVDEGSGMSRAAGRDLPGLEPDSPAVAAMRSQRGVVGLAFDPDVSGHPAAAERQARWAEATGLSLLVPLVGRGSGLLGFIGVGPKRNEMPFEEGDRLALRAVATAASLAVENLRLRSSPGSQPHVESFATSESGEAIASGDLAFWCPLCLRVFSSASGGLCGEDGTPLQAGDAPHVLAGRYLFERRLGAGGMGAVWLARDLSLGRSVAVKTLSRISADAATRFRREARAAARFLHPNLATILTSETWRGVPVLVFEYLEGGTLAQRLQAGPCSPHEVARWGALLAGALHAAHDGGVLHRDVKPSNIGFTSDGTPKLLDFGLAAVFDDAEERRVHAGDAPDATDRLPVSLEKTVSRLTRSGAIVGTIPYLSPEAVLGRPAKASFDLWGLTLSLYEAVTGRNPFFGGTAHETLNRILSERAPDPRELRPDCPAALAAVLARNLSRNVEERARTAAVLRAEFLALSDLHGGVS